MTLAVDLMLIVVTIIGFIEWLIAILRISAIAKGKQWQVALLVAVENLMGFFVIFKMIDERNFSYAIAYTIGASIAGYFASKK